MAGRRKRPRSDDLVNAYRRIRKPVPKPARVEPDRRDKLAERAERRDRREGEE